MTLKEMREWVEERDIVVKTYDVQKFKEFYAKWYAKGIYQMPLPKDEIIEISMRKMVCEIKSSTDQEKEEARRWLKERGHKEGI